MYVCVLEKKIVLIEIEASEDKTYYLQGVQRKLWFESNAKYIQVAKDDLPHHTILRQP